MGYLPFSRTERAIEGIGYDISRRALGRTRAAETEIRGKLALAQVGVQKERAASAGRINVLEAIGRRDTAAATAKFREDEATRRAKEKEDTTKFRAEQLRVEEEKTAPTSMFALTEQAAKTGNYTSEAIAQAHKVGEATYGRFYRSVMPKNQLGSMIETSQRQLKEEKALQTGKEKFESLSKEKQDKAINTYQDRINSATQKISLIKGSLAAPDPLKYLEENDGYNIIAYLLGKDGRYDKEAAGAALESLQLDIDNSTYERDGLLIRRDRMTANKAAERVNELPPPKAGEAGDRTDEETGLNFRWNPETEKYQLLQKKQSLASGTF